VKTLVAVATYNELVNLPSLVEAIEAALPDADVLVVDDNSPDGTGRWSEERAATDSRFAVLHRSGKLGLGSATYAAFRYAIERGYDVVATLDADWSHPPERLPVLLAALTDADVAIGSRYCPGGAIEGWPLRRQVMSRIVNRAARFALRLPVQDCSGAFRAYRVELLKQIDFATLQESGYAYLEEILWRLKLLGARFAETPITFTDRRAGESKINWREAVAAGKLIASLGWRERFGGWGRR
jgi:dolichol-phosphate mannosyltransferase